ncbi:MAG: hypothetical protein J6386_18880 [Candidatus Synoicihabitans palmerolidicus]|nr:hypothetical protein [Candidatus Synoicihabitans palmerolidicus]
MGSRYCDYRVRAALTHCAERAPHFVVSGGGMMKISRTEAEYIRTMLASSGVPSHRISVSVREATSLPDNAGNDNGTAMVTTSM